jgi:hypothetical protein
MGFPQKVSVTVTTASDGTATAYTECIRGKVIAIGYAKAASGNFADGVDFTITTEDVGQGLWTDTNVNASEVVYPKQLNDGVDGADLTAIYDHVRVFNERVKIVIAQGGDTKVGTFTVYYE